VCSSLRVPGSWMLTIKSYSVDFEIAGCVEEMVRDPNLMPRECLYIVVLLSTLTLHDSYPRITGLIT